MNDGAGKLLIIWHSRTGAAQALARAAWQGAKEQAHIVRAQDADADLILAHDAYLFVCPENLASMSGAMKEMFDQTYYPVLGKVEGRAYATIIAAGSDGEGAQRQIDRIATGWRLRRVVDPVIVNFAAQTAEAILTAKSLDVAQEELARNIGSGLNEGLKLGVF